MTVKKVKNTHYNKRKPNRASFFMGLPLNFYIKGHFHWSLLLPFSHETIIYSLFVTFQYIYLEIIIFPLTMYVLFIKIYVYTYNLIIITYKSDWQIPYLRITFMYIRIRKGDWKWLSIGRKILTLNC